MADLRTTYMGLKLRNPIVVASSPLTASLEGLVKCEQAGAGAVVLKSIFEEKVNQDTLNDTTRNGEFLEHSDFADVYGNISKDFYINQYLQLIADAKKKLSIPVIASINCSHVDSWQEYAKRFEAAGADALELNYYPIASNAAVSGEKVDKAAVAFARQARKAVKLPLSIKIGYEYSSLANIITAFSKEGIDAMVLFNRFYRPDIDIDTLSLSGMQATSEGTEYAESLRWIALMAAELPKMDFAASTGVHSGETVIKMLLAGASVTEVCSAVMKNGHGVIAGMLCQLEKWMDDKGFATIDAFNGKLAQENMADGAKWERTQYMQSLN